MNKLDIKLINQIQFQHQRANFKYSNKCNSKINNNNK